MSGSELYKAKWTSGESFDAPCTKVVCVGRNYAEHARELNNPVPEAPILFIKPESSIQDGEVLSLPRSDIHYEAELAVLIGRDCKDAAAVDASLIAGLGLGLDLTDRALQSQLKEKGHPWERAKAFDGATWLGSFVPYAEEDLSALLYALSINDVAVQEGNSADMLFPVLALLKEIVSSFTLRKGDVVLTGTPKGVGTLKQGDKLDLELDTGRSKFKSSSVRVNILG